LYLLSFFNFDIRYKFRGGDQTSLEEGLKVYSIFTLSEVVVFDFQNLDEFSNKLEKISCLISLPI